MKRLNAIYKNVQSKVLGKLAEQKGATMLEYALMVALIAAVCVVTVTSIGTKANSTFNTVDSAFK